MASDFELPEEDPALEALDVAARQRVGREWRRRAEVELSAATLSAQIVHGLLLDRAVPEVLELAARAVADEVRHAEICRRVAERYLGEEVAPPHSRRIDEPVFGSAGPELSRLLGLVLHSCINETLATVCLREGLKVAESTRVRAATRMLLADDLNHARLGWAHLASPVVDADGRHHIGQALPTLLRLGVEGWLSEPRANFDEPAHGVLGNARFPGLMRSALLELILPGFEYVGISTLAAREWYRTMEPKLAALTGALAC